MTTQRDMLDWIDAQATRMRQLVTELAGINSGTANLAGLARTAERLTQAFAVLGAPVERIDLPQRVEISAKGNEVSQSLGQALRWRKPTDRVQPGAKRLFLCIHYDTVYGADSPFQQCDLIDANTLRGPGVADAKGGIAVMLIALEAIERSTWRDRIAWEVVLNPDEEIGSPGSAELLREAAGRHDVGLLFEPALEGGTFAAGRKGSGNFALIVRGKAAHAGRAFHDGRNALHLAAEAVTKLTMLNEARSPGWGVTVNVGRIDGGGPNNIVTDLAVVRCNVRVSTADEQAIVELALGDLLKVLISRDGFAAELYGGFTSPPKAGAMSASLLYELRECGKALGLDVKWKDTGGVCDGNKLAAAGLPNIDTLGPRGGAIHSDNEYLLLDSLTERAKLAALLMVRIADPLQATT